MPAIFTRMSNELAAFEGLGKALRWIRDKQARKQYQVAESAGVTKAMLSAYETGKQRPSIDTLERILGALSVDLADLFQALQIVNERPRLGKNGLGLIDAQATFGARYAGAIDVYHTLGLERALHPAEEAALAEMLAGFHRLLRYMHERAATLRPFPERPEANDV